MEWLLKKYKSDKTTFLIFAFAYAFLILLIYHSASRPMWFDEAWRAYYIDHNFNKELLNNSGAAPISAGVYAVTKAAVFFVNNNFTQRIVSYLALLILPWIVYKFCRINFGKLVAQVSIPVTLLSGSILEYSTQNKPYILDVVCVLGILFAYKLYADKKTSLAVLTIVSVVASLFSFGAFFALPCVGLFLLIRYIKNRDRARLKDLLIWSAAVGSVILLHAWLFLGPQIHNDLSKYWQGLFLTGSPKMIIKSIVSNCLSFFGLAIDPLFVNTQGLNSRIIFWSYPEIAFGLNLSVLMGSGYLILFLYGMYDLVKRKKLLVPVTIVVILGLQLVTAYLSKWPFGNARTNIFLTTLILLVTCYAAVKLAQSMVTHKEWGAIFIMLTLLLLAFPLNSIVKNGIFGRYSPGFGEGVQASAVMVAKGSKPEDQILLYHYMTNYRFKYYYQDSSYATKYKNRSQNILVDSRQNPLPHSVEFFKNNKHKTIWVVVLRGVSYNPAHFAVEAGYRATESKSYQFLQTYKLEK